MRMQVKINTRHGLVMCPGISLKLLRPHLVTWHQGDRRKQYPKATVREGLDSLFKSPPEFDRLVQECIPTRILLARNERIQGISRLLANQRDDGL